MSHALGDDPPAKGFLAVGNAMLDVSVESGPPGRGCGAGGVRHVSRHEIDEAIRGASSWKAVSGGSAANAAKLAAWLGTPASFMGAVGDDDWGRRFEKDMRDAGVKCLVVTKDEPTGLVVSFPSPGGLANLGASAFFTPEDLLEPLVRQSDTILMEGYLLLVPGLVERILALSGETGARVAFDAGNPFIARRFREVILDDIIPHLWLLSANESELDALGGCSDDGCRRGFADSLPCAVLMKRGPDGAEFRQGGKSVSVEAVKADAVDETGCGDAFLGAFLHAEGKGFDIERCMKAGAQAAGTVLGCRGTDVDPDTLRTAVGIALGPDYPLMSIRPGDSGEE